LHIDGRPVRYRETGAGVPLVILSGLGLSSNFYQENLNGLAKQGIRTIAPDLPGFGGSRGRFTGMSIADAASWTVEFCSTLQITKAFFLGHSIGCQIALRVAADHAHRTLGLILSGPTGARRHRLLHQSGALARIALREGVHVLRKVALDYLRTTPSQYAGWWVRAARDRPLDIASVIKAPVLVLIGSDDPVPTADFIAELMQRLPNAELSEMTGGLHALPIEQPAEFNRRVAAFVRRFESRALPDKA
jgi:2-hydroxy-6-oxonona-2,4-dienedioate hydrolase